MTRRHRLMLLFLWMVLLLLLLIEPTGSITPEDVRFATMRCQSDSTQSLEMREQWTIRMFPDNRETHCYVKCLLSKLGLINLKYRGLDSNKLIQPVEERGIEINEECYVMVDENLGGTCDGYYRKWMALRENCKELFDITLFEDPMELANSSEGKPLGISATEYCDDDTISSKSTELTSAQTRGNDMLHLFRCELECVFEHIRYFDAYGRLDELEIKRSFAEANADSVKNLKVLANCVHQANMLYSVGPCHMAYRLYQCLLKKLTNFRAIYAQRDKISRLY